MTRVPESIDSRELRHCISVIRGFFIGCDYAAIEIWRTRLVMIKRRSKWTSRLNPT